MAIDTPAKIAILGAGPIGLEAALYARFLGYDVAIFDRGEVAAAVQQWGHVRMFTPFGRNRSPLGLAALHAQDEQYQPPDDAALLTGSEWTLRYLLPLSQTDLLADHLRLNTTVVAIAKEELLKADMPGHEDRGDWPFRLLVHNAAGEERIEEADCVLDCSGVFGQANWLGHGGLPAVGEIALRDSIEHRLPDIVGASRARYAGQHVLLVGGGCSAATNAVALADLIQQAPGTRVTWITRREGPAGAGGPVWTIENDRLQQRAALAAQANRLVADPASGIAWRPRTNVERIARATADGPFEVVLSGEHAGTLSCDQIIANVGFRPDHRLYEELQIHECFSTQASTSAQPTGPQATGPQALVNPEPNFYILGAKSYGRRPDFLFSIGLAQIRELFTIIGDRATLDLYASATRLP